ncbi:hypothetical protein [Frankia gtarii]|uniref:hypothetical protein n=1 Tax=Frankia gtarii TaxID=2950102 RepID=UPI0021BFE80A|nr:hypothetical protein [Frankia gtarii]
MVIMKYFHRYSLALPGKSKVGLPQLSLAPATEPTPEPVLVRLGVRADEEG